MSDYDPDHAKALDKLARNVRDSAGVEAEARWQADEARRAAHLEAQTAASVATERYMTTRITHEEREAARIDAHRRTVEKLLARECDALESIASALRAK